MATVLEQTTFTTEQLLAMPDDGMERWLIDGELREKPMTVRNRIHSEITAIVTYYLVNWNRTQPEPRGRVSNGEVGFRLSRNPDSTVGVDVAYAPPEVVHVESDDETTLYEGPPLLAVEVLSPNDTQQQINEKVRKYLEAGTKLVWVIDPAYPTLTVHEAGKLPILYNSQQSVSGDPYLPGLIVPVGELVQ
jgi:Uma2 family endonuclease